MHKEKPGLLKGVVCPGSLLRLTDKRQMFDVWLHQDSLWGEVRAREGAGAGGPQDEAATTCHVTGHAADGRHSGAGWPGPTGL